MSDNNSSLNLGDVLHKTFDGWKKIFLPVAGLQFLAYLPSILSSFYIDNNYPGVKPEDLPANIALMNTVAYLLTAILSIFVLGVLYKSAVEAVQDKPLQWGEIMRMGWSRWGRVLWTAFVLFLAIMLGFALLIIPGIIVIINTFLLFSAMFAEDLTMSASWKRSNELVRGMRWKVLGYIIVINLILLIPFFVEALWYAAAKPAAPITENNFYFSQLIGLFIFSAYAVFQTVIYFNRRAQASLQH